MHLQKKTEDTDSLVISRDALERKTQTSPPEHYRRSHYNPTAYICIAPLKHCSQQCLSHYECQLRVEG